ncbi:hypothetical protein AABB24_017087, partial [Solanum stoloniferum]
KFFFSIPLFSKISAAPPLSLLSVFRREVPSPVSSLSLFSPSLSRRHSSYHLPSLFSGEEQQLRPAAPARPIITSLSSLQRTTTTTKRATSVASASSLLRPASAKQQRQQRHQCLIPENPISENKAGEATNEH